MGDVLEQPVSGVRRHNRTNVSLKAHTLSDRSGFAVGGNRARRVCNLGWFFASVLPMRTDSQIEGVITPCHREDGRRSWEGVTHNQPQRPSSRRHH